jgi:hypothetical protein
MADDYNIGEREIVLMAMRNMGRLRDYHFYIKELEGQRDIVWTRATIWLRNTKNFLLDLLDFRFYTSPEELDERCKRLRGISPLMNKVRSQEANNYIFNYYNNSVWDLDEDEYGSDFNVADTIEEREPFRWEWRDPFSWEGSDSVSSMGNADEDSMWLDSSSSAVSSGVSS